MKIVLIFPILFIISFGEALHPDNDEKLVIDNDAGGDDSMAIFLALLYEKHFTGPKVIALTTGNGNTNEGNVCKNNQRILMIAKRGDVPIYRGSRKSLVSTPATNAYYGKDGMGDISENLNIKDLVAPQKKRAAQALIDLSKEYEGQLTVITIGTLTNVALAMLLDPLFLGRLKQLYVGAGHIYDENHSNAEFNARMDAEAYHIVVENASPDKVTVIPFSQVINSVNYTKVWRQEVLGAINSDIVKAQNNYESVSLRKSNYWHKLDPAVMAVVLRPDLVEEYKYATNDIILCGEERGKNTNKFVSENEANVRIVFSIKHDEYKQFLMDVFSKNSD